MSPAELNEENLQTVAIIIIAIIVFLMLTMAAKWFEGRAF